MRIMFRSCIVPYILKRIQDLLGEVAIATLPGERLAVRLPPDEAIDQPEEKTIALDRHQAQCIKGHIEEYGFRVAPLDAPREADPPSLSLRMWREL